MLHIFYGRENKNKDQFLFDSIKGRTLLLVPDQFTLQAERDAFFYLGTKGLMDLEVVSISRLGMKVLAETGGGRCPMIDKYGRHMLLTKILREKKEALGIYRGQEKKQSFIEMMNNFISELKKCLFAQKIAGCQYYLPQLRKTDSGKISGYRGLCRSVRGENYPVPDGEKLPDLDLRV